MLQIFSNIFTVLYILLVVGTIIIILTDNQDSGRKISWILVIGLVPVLGLICYVVFGFNWRRAGFFQRRHRNFLHEFDRKADDRIKDLLFGHSSEEKIQEDYRELARLLAKVNKITVSDDNDIEINNPVVFCEKIYLLHIIVGRTKPKKYLLSHLRFRRNDIILRTITEQRVSVHIVMPPYASLSSNNDSNSLLVIFSFLSRSSAQDSNTL